MGISSCMIMLAGAIETKVEAVPLARMAAAWLRLFDEPLAFQIDGGQSARPWAGSQNVPLRPVHR